MIKPKNSIKGTPLQYNAGIQQQYLREIRRMIQYMAAETRNAILRLYETPVAKKYFAQDASLASQARILTNDLTKRFDQLFGRRAKILTDRLMNDTYRVSTAALSNSLREISKEVTLPTSAITPQLKEMIKAAANENVKLITSIPAQYLGRVEGAIMRSLTAPANGVKTIMQELVKYDGITHRQARERALGMTRYVYNTVNAERMKAVKTPGFYWLHSGGGHAPRKSHIAMNGKFYTWDNLPVINLDSPKDPPVKGLPGQIYGCGCTMAPGWDLNEEKDNATS